MAEIDVTQTRYILKGILASGAVVELTNLVLELSWSDPAEEIAQRANISIANTKTDLGYLSDIIKLCTEVRIFANQQEVFRGIIWEWEYSSALQKEIKLTAYSKIIYAVNSKDHSYFTAGKSTKAIIEDICGRWGIQLKYEWGSHTHPVVKYSNAISEQILNTLDDAKRKLDKKYALFMEEDVLIIRDYGKNNDVFYFHGKNIMSTTNKLTLDGLVTKVIIFGKDIKEGRPPIEHSETGNLDYGTIQEMVSRDGNTSLADAKAEAKKIIQDKGKPKETIGIQSPDVPQIRKGDKINVVAGNLSGFFYVDGVTHDATNRTMDMEVTRNA